MHITTTRHELTLTTPFRISRGVEYTVPIIAVAIQHGEHTGYSKASPDEYYGESPATVLACLAQFSEQLGDDPFALEDILRRLNKTIRFNPAAKAAVDMDIPIMADESCVTVEDISRIVGCVDGIVIKLNK